MRPHERSPLGIQYQGHDFRYLMTIQQATETQSADGAVVQTWSTFADINAWYEAFEGNETTVAQGIEATTIHKVIAREVAGVVPKMRLLFGIRVFEIVSVVPFRQEQMRLMKLLCTEEV